MASGNRRLANPQTDSPLLYNIIGVGMKIAIDFDGTCVTHAFPKVGRDIGAEFVLRRLKKEGHKLFLFTMRADRKDKNPTQDSTILDVTGMFLQDALDWFKEKEVDLDGIQTDPAQKNWTVSPKCYAELYIDDAGLGFPLIYNKDFSPRPYADWVAIEKWLEFG